MSISDQEFARIREKVLRLQRGGSASSVNLNISGANNLTGNNFNLSSSSGIAFTTPDSNTVVINLTGAVPQPAIYSGSYPSPQYLAPTISGSGVQANSRIVPIHNVTNDTIWFIPEAANVATSGSQATIGLRGQTGTAPGSVSRGGGNAVILGGDGGQLVGGGSSYVLGGKGGEGAMSQNGGDGGNTYIRGGIPGLAGMGASAGLSGSVYIGDSATNQINIGNTSTTTTISGTFYFSSPAGGVLGYSGSTYPNPSGLAASVSGGGAVADKIPIKQGTLGVTVKYDQFNEANASNREFTLEGADAYSFPNPLAGGSITIQGGKGNTQPVVMSGDGGSAILVGGTGVGTGNGGVAQVIGGYAGNSGAGGETRIYGGNGPGGTNGGDVVIRGGENVFQNATGGDVTIRGGDGVTDGVVNVGLTTTSKINIGATGITTEVYGNFIAPILGDASGSANATTVVAIQGQPVTSSTPLTGDSFYYSGSAWIHRQITPKYGNVVLVDGINGNDSLGVVNGFPFATVNAAINYVSSSALTNTLVYIAPNNYTLTNGITIPATCALRGMSTQTTKLVLTGSGAETTMFTMGENTRIEDLNLVLVSTSSTTNLTGIKLTGTTGTTSKLRTAVLTVDNSSVTASANTNVYGIWCSGSADLSPSDFSFNFTRGVTVNVFSNGGGNKRGIYADTNTAVTFRDTNIYVRAPTSALSTGSYVGVETTNASSSLQFRTTSISGAPTSGSYSGSDIYQFEPATGFIDRGIQLGPGTDLINKTAGARPFTTYVTPTTLNYGLRGNIANGTYYYWNGMQLTADATQVFYRFQQKSILQGMSVQLRVPPGSVAGTHVINVTVLKSTTGVVGSGAATLMTASLTDGDTAAYNYNCSVDFQRGEYLALETTTVGGAGAAADLAVQLDLF